MPTRRSSFSDDAPGDALAAEKDVLIQGVASGVGLGEDFSAGTVPPRGS